MCVALVILPELCVPACSFVAMVDSANQNLSNKKLSE